VAYEHLVSSLFAFEKRSGALELHIVGMSAYTQRHEKV
jgi:hypothetical protein